MPKLTTSPEEDVQFLMLCLHFAPKPDFEKVAAAMPTPTKKTAAYKKLWDMQKKFQKNNPSLASGGGTSSAEPSPKKPQVVITKANAAKKRKAADREEEEEF